MKRGYYPREKEFTLSARVNKLGATAIILVALAYIANLLLIHAVAPNSQDRTLSRHVDQNGIEYVFVDRLSLSPLFNNESVSGYVNVIDGDDTVYLDRDWFASRSDRSRYFLSMHESFHVFQKREAAKRAGGFPSKTNPIQTARYAKELANIELKFREDMPQNNDAPNLSRGIETSADCYGQLMLGMSTLPDGAIVPSYTKEWCSDTQLDNVREFATSGKLPGE